MANSQQDHDWMQRALELAGAGQGHVEPNPMVGCVIARGDQLLAEGYHQQYGGPHAEVIALAACKEALDQATLYVTLEPCCHQGKTPPCSDAIIAAGIRRVVVADRDPFPAVAGAGIRQLSEAGIGVVEGVGQQAARQLVAPYRKRLLAGQPWVIAKWAMTLDGRIATRSGDSKWISNQASRQVVHQLRGRVDAILVGRGTVVADNPQLTARPAGARTALRVVMTESADLPVGCQLLETARQIPLLVSCTESADEACRQRVRDSGAELLVLDKQGNTIQQLLDELASRQLTNVLVEGGAGLLGGFRDGDFIDEVHVFMAPQLIGGQQAPGPVGGEGSNQLAESLKLEDPQLQTLDGDVYLHGLVANRPWQP